MKEEIRTLEKLIETLRDLVIWITFQDEKYTNDVCKCVIALSSLNVSINNTDQVIKVILNKLRKKIFKGYYQLNVFQVSQEIVCVLMILWCVVVDNCDSTEMNFGKLVIQEYHVWFRSSKPLFKTKLKSLRENLIPKLIGNWDGLSEVSKTELGEMGMLFVSFIY